MLEEFTLLPSNELNGAKSPISNVCEMCNNMRAIYEMLDKILAKSYLFQQMVKDGLVDSMPDPRDTNK